MSLRKFKEELKMEKSLCVKTDNTVTEYCIRRWRGKGKLLLIMRKVRR
jgi:hypothetical protein